MHAVSPLWFVVLTGSHNCAAAAAPVVRYRPKIRRGRVTFVQTLLLVTLLAAALALSRLVVQW